MKVLYDNYIINSLITASSEDADYPFSYALTDSRLSRVGRTTSVSNQSIVFDLQKNLTIDSVAITKHNIINGYEELIDSDNNNIVDESGNNIIMLDSGVIKLQGNFENLWTSPDFEIEVDYFGEWYYSLVNAGAYRFWRLSFDGCTSADAYFEIGYVFLGESLTMPGMNRAMIIPQKTNSASSKSTSGQLYGDKRLNYKAAEIKCEVIEEDERQLIKTFFNYVDIITPFVLLIWEDDLDVEEPIYCNLTEELSWNKLDINGLLWSLSMKFEECF